MTGQEKALEAFAAWYEGLANHRASGGVARGTIGAALVVLERLKTHFDLHLEVHRAPGGSQIKGLSAAAVAAILARFDETRPFLREGGRTNRGGPGDIRKMLEAINATHLDDFPAEERNQILEEFQRFLVDKVLDFHNRQRLKIVYNPLQSTWQAISDLLSSARESGKEGPVAQYLVGAKLQLRFPDVSVGNESYSTADEQLGRPGDFFIGDTVFHVTVAPQPGVYEKCKQNIQQGLRAYLLVPYRWLVGARQNAEAIMPGQITVESIESFVSQNIEELSTFSKNQLAHGFKRLLETYNTRVDATENDKSMLVEIPTILLR